MELQAYTFQNDEGVVFSMGRDKAFDFIFRQYYTPLCFFANKIINNRDEAQDIVQDCFVKLWDQKAFEDRPETVKSFLYLMVQNKCIDVLRKIKTRKAKEVQIKNMLTDSNVEYFDEVVFAELTDKILSQIDQLPATMQQVIKKYYLEGKKCKEIAVELNSSSEAIYKHKTR